jgi:hypothetical protein
MRELSCDVALNIHTVAGGLSLQSGLTSQTAYAVSGLRGHAHGYVAVAYLPPRVVAAAGGRAACARRHDVLPAPPSPRHRAVRRSHRGRHGAVQHPLDGAHGHVRRRPARRGGDHRRERRRDVACPHRRRRGRAWTAQATVTAATSAPASRSPMPGSSASRRAAPQSSARRTRMRRSVQLRRGLPAGPDRRDSGRTDGGVARLWVVTTGAERTIWSR